jgi:RNA polymerase sigma-70 factor (ECF subfamily)
MHASVTLDSPRQRDRRSDLEAVAAEFELVRPRLLAVAHRILGVRAEAEDIVQDAWLRWQTCDRNAVNSSTAFLVTTTTRLAINALQSARSRHESCSGPSALEAVDATSDPAVGAERTEALEHGAMALLERLTAAERAAYVLRRAFDRTYGDIAATLGLSEANVRQLVSRAGKHLTTARRRPVAPDEHRRLVSAFLASSRGRDLTALEQVLVADVVAAAHRCRPTIRRCHTTDRHLVLGSSPLEGDPT